MLLFGIVSVIVLFSTERACATRGTLGTFPKATRSLVSGNWVKLICGASNADLPLIRNLCYVYTLSGVDCIDVCADTAVVRVAQEAIDAASSASESCRPLLMISVNDDEDPHFRKAVFDPRKCPAECKRPCEKVCPAAAIPPLVAPPGGERGGEGDGVIAERCYGCGRCEPVCPLGLIINEPYITNRDTIKDLFMTRPGSNLRGVDAIEIHTHEGNEAAFQSLWEDIGEVVLSQASVIAVSFPDMASRTPSYINRLYGIMAKDEVQHAEFLQGRHGVHIWQTDGRPMSGDIGMGTAHASSEFASRMLRALKAGYVDHRGDSSSAGGTNRPIEGQKTIDLFSGKHFLQLAGGTNAHSVTTARTNDVVGQRGFGGFAFGGYARKILGETLREVEESAPGARIEAEEHHLALELCLKAAEGLVGGIKG
jgi:Fe-S-cluster-containing hydrogenase component 2